MNKNVPKTKPNGEPWSESELNSFYNTPPSVSGIIKKYIKDKVFCDLGCRDAEFLEKCLKYCKKGIGIEVDDFYYKQAKERQKKNKNLIIKKGNVLDCKIPKADVYYTWINPYQIILLVNKIEKGIIIFGITHNDIPELLALLDNNGEKIIIKDQETISGAKRDFVIGIVKK